MTNNATLRNALRRRRRLLTGGEDSGPGADTAPDANNAAPPGNPPAASGQQPGGPGQPNGGGPGTGVAPGGSRPPQRPPPLSPTPALDGGQRAGDLRQHLVDRIGRPAPEAPDGLHRQLLDALAATDTAQQNGNDLAAQQAAFSHAADTADAWLAMRSAELESDAEAKATVGRVRDGARHAARLLGVRRLLPAEEANTMRDADRDALADATEQMMRVDLAPTDEEFALAQRAIGIVERFSQERGGQPQTAAIRRVAELRRTLQERRTAKDLHATAARNGGIAANASAGQSATYRLNDASGRPVAFFKTKRGEFGNINQEGTGRNAAGEILASFLSETVQQQTGLDLRVPRTLPFTQPSYVVVGEGAEPLHGSIQLAVPNVVGEARDQLAITSALTNAAPEVQRANETGPEGAIRRLADRMVASQPAIARTPAARRQLEDTLSDSLRFHLDRPPGAAPATFDADTAAIALLDLMTLQVDRNAGNVLHVAQDGSTRGVPIDHGDTLPGLNSAIAWTGRPMHYRGATQVSAWRDLEGSDRPLDPTMVQAILAINAKDLSEAMARESERISRLTDGELPAMTADQVMVQRLAVQTLQAALRQAGQPAPSPRALASLFYSDGLQPGNTLFHDALERAMDRVTNTEGLTLNTATLESLEPAFAEALNDVVEADVGGALLRAGQPTWVHDLESAAIELAPRPETDPQKQTLRAISAARDAGQDNLAAVMSRRLKARLDHDRDPDRSALGRIQALTAALRKRAKTAWRGGNATLARDISDGLARVEQHEREGRYESAEFQLNQLNLSLTLSANPAPPLAPLRPDPAVDRFIERARVLGPQPDRGAASDFDEP